MLTVTPARHRQVIASWLVVTICFSVAAGLIRGPSRGVSELKARGAVSMRVLALLCSISTASAATGPPVVTSQDNLDICIPSASSTGCAPGMLDLCILSDQNQLPPTSFNHGSECGSMGSHNISSTSPEVNFTSGAYYSTLVIPVGDKELGAPMGPELCITGGNLMEYDLASREVAAAGTCSRFITPVSDDAMLTENRRTESLERPRAVQRRSAAISVISARHVMPPVLCGEPGHVCIQESSSLINGVMFFTMTSPINVTIRRSDPLGTEVSGACALMRCLRHASLQMSHPIRVGAAAQALICRAPSNPAAMTQRQQFHTGLYPPCWLPKSLAQGPLGSAWPPGSSWLLRFL